MKSAAGQLAYDYCQQFPTAGTRTLAKKLTDEHPKVFRSFEHARGFVRDYRGKHGSRRREDYRKANSLVECKPLAKPPESRAVDVKNYVLKVTGKGAIMSDFHVPYHDPKTIRVAVEWLEAQGFTDYLVILGDLLDCYSVSRWDTDPRKRDFRMELVTCQQMLRYLGQRFKKIVWKFGNHEARYEKYLWSQAPVLVNLPGMSLSSMIRRQMPVFNDRTGEWEDPANEFVDGLDGIEFVDEHQLIEAGHLTMLHGHEVPKGIANPVNQARSMSLRCNASTVSAHGHRTSNHVERSVRGKEMSSWSLGCLCQLRPKYMPVNKWNHGFATMEFDGRWFEVENKRIVEGRVV